MPNILLVKLRCSQSRFFSETGGATTCTGSDHGFPETSWNFVGKICADPNVNRNPTITNILPENMCHETSKPRSPCICPCIVRSPSICPCIVSVSWQIHGILGFMTNYFEPKIKRIRGGFGRCSIVFVDARPFKNEFGFVASISFFLGYYMHFIWICMVVYYLLAYLPPGISIHLAILNSGCQNDSTL